MILSNFYRPQRSWGKVMFLHVSVILFTGGGRPQYMLGYTPPPRSRHQPPGSRQTPPEQCLLGDTGNKRAIRILLECILVNFWSNSVQSVAPTKGILASAPVIKRYFFPTPSQKKKAFRWIAFTYHFVLIIDLFSTELRQQVPSACIILSRIFTVTSIKWT